MPGTGFGLVSVSLADMRIQPPKIDRHENLQASSHRANSARGRGTATHEIENVPNERSIYVGPTKYGFQY